ncbi:MAG: adenylate kinase [Ornithinimicrobium sp.]
MRLLILGAPGAGKGTQAVHIAKRLDIPAISTGDIFRKNISEETELGLKVKSILASGGFVPDDVTIDIVRDRLTEEDAQGGFLLDGFPRTPGQVEALDEMLSDQGASLDAVVELTVDTDEVVQRLLQRAQEQGRADDTEEVIRERMNLYAEETAPLSSIYRSRGVLIHVDGMGEVDEVTNRVFAALDSLGESA